MAPQPIFSGALGLNTKIDPARLGRSNSGFVELSEAVNVAVDDSGRVNRALPLNLQHAAKGDSIWTDGHRVILAGNGTLRSLSSDGAETELVDGLALGAAVRFQRYTWSGADGVHDDLFWCNGSENGRIALQDIRALPWESEELNGVSGQRIVGRAPIGHLLALWDDRVWIAQSLGSNNVIWCTERYAPLNIRMSVRFIALESRPTMLASVENGLVVSTAERLFFYYPAGDSGELGRRLLADYPAVEGTDVPVMGGDILDGEIPGQGVVFATSKGVCFAGPSGELINMTKEKVEYPLSRRGSATAIGGNYFVFFHR